MNNLVSKYPVKVSDIKVSKATAELTKIEDYISLMKAVDSGTLFKAMNEAQLTELIFEKLHKGGLKKRDKNVINSYTQEEKLQYLINNLTINFELTQEREGNGSTDEQLKPSLNKSFGLFMGSRVNIGNSDSIKYHYQAATIGSAKELGITLLQNLTESFAKQGKFVYIQRLTSFEPEILEGNVNSVPKRAGKGGDILTKDGKLLFMSTNIITEDLPELSESFTEVDREELISTYFTQVYEEETENSIDYAHDKGAEIDAEEVPSEQRDPETGRFSEPFQNWVNARYAEYTIGIQTAIKSQVEA